MANHVAGRCVEMMGGVGFVKDYPVEKFYRDAKIGELYTLLILPGAHEPPESKELSKYAYTGYLMYCY